jgi:Pyridoxamine 5'-phosphate oxidase
MACMPSWDGFEAQAPALAAFGAERLTSAPGYLATIRRDGRPRVHPVAPIIGGGRLFVFMEPTSPKGHDLRDRGWYSLHNGVLDTFGTGGEFHVSGRATLMDDDEIRAVVTGAAGYQPEDRYILFELGVNEARCHGYGDVPLPNPGNWVLPIG